ncbi:MAG: right-handed parallel beta-helix repeat-containing protein, partial [Candidatus Thermoplasmatota archaeon]|nr:right-handed parallel beta-helix repeat-containing protein [Candidatus Thermoplasmatota archaeon]
DTSNIINGKPIYYIIEQNNFVFDSIEVGYLALISCSNVTVKNLTLVDNSQGLLLANTSYSTITANLIYNNFWGISLHSSSYNNISANQIHNNDYGIELWHSSNNNITNCTVYNNSGDGIYVSYSSNNEIRYNDIYNNTNYGVYSHPYMNNATYNWWGSLNGPGQDGANPVSLNVLYNPWLTEPWTGEDVNQPPVADFTYSPALIVSTTGRIINFMDLSYDPDGNITAWFWGFGDNNTSILQNPTHQYLVAGNYTVNLTVTDDDDATNTTSKQVTIFGFIITNLSLTNFTILNLTYLNISYIVNITNAIIINISCINITNLMNITNVSLINVSYINVTNLMNISNMSFANVFEVTLTNFTYMSSSSFINVSYVNITQSMGINNLMFNNVGYAHLQNVTNVNFVITAILNIITIAYENLQMVIPAEALILSMPFNLSTTSVSLPPGYDVVGDMYRIECGVSIGAPISITLSYAGMVLPLGISEDDLAVYKKVGDNWIKIDSVIDKLNSTVSAQVTSFSDYAILYKQPSTEDEEESKPSAKPFEIPWLYIIIPIIIIILVVTGMGIKRRKKKLPPKKPTG